MKQIKWFVFILVLVVLIPSVFAAGETWTMVSIDARGCSSGGFTMTVNRSGLDGGSYYWHTTASVNGVVYMNEGFNSAEANGTRSWSLFDNSSGGAAPGVWPIPTGQEVRILFQLERPQGTPIYQWMLIVDGCDTGNINYNGPFPPPAGALSGQGLVPAFYDGRINDYDTGNPVVLYPIADGESRGLHVYNADSSGLIMMISAATIDAVADCPSQNTLIYQDSASGVSLWRLTLRPDGNCPFQLNAPTGEPGKTYIIIFDELYPNTHYESHEEFFGG